MRGGFAGSGVLLLNKGPGLSSNAALQRVRRLLGNPKAGHAGTLDPGATGLLLLCLGTATRIASYLGGLEKEYEGAMRFGEETDTLDAEGRVVARAPTDRLTPALVAAAMTEFLGETMQLPPMYSAVKVGGRRLYERARRGEEVARAARPVRVREFSLLEWAPPLMRFRVRCGGGTYVRVLCQDLARRCGSAGHMTSLTRTATGPFRLRDAVDLQGLEETVRQGGCPRLISPSEALAHLPLFPVAEGEAAAVRQGQPLLPPPGAEEDVGRGEPVRLVGAGGRLLALARFEGEGRPMPFERVFP